ncbi:hypothetical protein F5050DRAFT_1251309 [Lentinula boryana]|uniref:Secreted protein n=1 Tax=Lentinula boryana TaxID=40481 RepID=A0ABQ8QT91_9AGAR|nr:hypothetical protein F5050DRAFT_1251309 [Lentinula boryana]
MARWTRLFEVVLACGFVLGCAQHTIASPLPISTDGEVAGRAWCEGPSSSPEEYRSGIYRCNLFILRVSSRNWKRII